MAGPWTLGRTLALIALILALVLLVVSMALPAVLTHLVLWTLILLAITAAGVVLG